MLASANYGEVGPAPGGAGAADTSFVTCWCLMRLRHLSGELQLLPGFILGNMVGQILDSTALFLPRKTALGQANAKGC